MATNRFEIFTRLVGGEHKLPPQLAKPSSPTNEAPLDQSTASASAEHNGYAESEDKNPVDAFGNLKTFDDFLAETPYPAPRAPAYTNRHAYKAGAAGRSQKKDMLIEGETGEDFALDPRKGEPSELGMSFCPFLAITKFPYKFVKSDFLQPLATAFFDEGKIYNRNWDMYYAFTDQSAKPISFVPLSQVQEPIDHINSSFWGLSWKFGPQHADEGLIVTFDDPNPNYRPRFLGNTTSRHQIDFFLTNVEPTDDDSDMTSPEDRSLETFKAKMDLAVDVAKNKSTRQKKEKQERFVLQRQGMGNHLLQAQRYLGLRAQEIPNALPDIAGLSIEPFDANKPARHLCESDVIIISIDVESYERAHGIITEVGVSTLDTRDLVGTAPEKRGENWHQFVRARHFRIIEHKGYVNGQFVSGCPDKFEFGQSEWVSLKNMPSVLTQCFHEPFSRPATGSSTPQESSEGSSQQRRNIVLLGHDIEQDIQYCHKLGFSVLGRGNMLATLDTRAMYQAYTRDKSPRGLGGIMYDFDFAAWHLHNAGNDAVYTIWAMLATCVSDAGERGTAESEKKHEDKLAGKYEDAIEAAKERVRADAEGWNLEAEGGCVSLPRTMAQAGGNGNAADHATPGHYTMGGALLDI